MALLRLMNFDRSTVASDFLTDFASTSGVGIVTGGSFGSNFLYMSYPTTNVVQVFNPIPTGTAGILGVRCKINSSGDMRIGIKDPSNMVHFYLVITSSGQMLINRGQYSDLTSTAGTLYTGIVGQVTSAAFNYIQIKYVIDATAGSIVVLLNGVTVINLSGVASRGQSSTDPTAIAYMLQGFGSFQDIYVADGTGAPPYNTFLGDLRLYLANPTGNGTLTQFTPVGAATNWQVAATSPMVPATIYNTSNTVGSTDLYTAAPLPASMTTILGVQVEAQIIKTDAGPRTATLEIKSGAAVATGVSHPLSVSVVNYTDIFAVDPATGAAWTVAGVNALQFGPTILT